MRSTRSINYKINERNYRFTTKKYIEGLLIFGSYVNGNYSSHSDIDHLLILSNEYRHKYHLVAKEVADELGIPPSWITAYTKKEISDRCRRGDYFFWSIYLNNIEIYSRSGFIQRLFKAMPLYKDVRQNLNKRLKYFQHLMNLWEEDRLSNKAMTIKIPNFYRNACINLLYLHGHIEFGKIQSAEKCQHLLQNELPFNLTAYKKLLNKKTVLTDKEIWAWCDSFREFHFKILRIEKQIMDHNFKSPLSHPVNPHKRAASF